MPSAFLYRRHPPLSIPARPRTSLSCVQPRGGSWAGTEVDALALLAENRQHLDRPGARGGEPVRDARVELGSFARAERDFLLAEYQPQAARKHVEPLVAVM